MIRINMKIRNIHIFTAVVAAALLSAPATAVIASETQPAVAASDPDDEDSDEEVVEEVVGDPVDNDDTYVRENPQIEYDDEIDIPIPDFIRIATNHIQLNGADWSKLDSEVGRGAKDNFVVVHIGDSHVQGGINTETTRELLQYDYGDGGLGIITPLKMSGTNEPRGYNFFSSGSWDAVKLMKHPWRRTMGFTGTSITPRSASSDLTIGTSARDDYDPFNSVLIFHRGKFTVNSVADAEGNIVGFKTIPSRDYTQIILDKPTNQITLSFSSEGDLTIFGASLSGDRPGVIYHSIGNNGATYATYNSIGDIGKGIAPLHPDLVIISLGTNEAFGRLDTQAFYRNIDRLVKDISSANPDTRILLTTPMECHKSVYSTKTSYKKVPVTTRKKGKKGRRKSTKSYVNKKITTRVKSYAVNNNIAPLRDQILRYGKDNKIAVYDWYEVAGGQGASNTWINNGYFSSDRVHHTAKGYRLMGRLLYEALIDELGRNQQSK